MATEKELCAEYDAYVTEHSLERMSAEELFAELVCERDSEKHKGDEAWFNARLAWLQDFMNRWELMLESAIR